jgi:hypothetical protein
VNSRNDIGTSWGGMRILTLSRRMLIFRRKVSSYMTQDQRSGFVEDGVGAGARVPGWPSNIAFMAAVTTVYSFRFYMWPRRYGSFSVLKIPTKYVT